MKPPYPAFFPRKGGRPSPRDFPKGGNDGKGRVATSIPLEGRKEDPQRKVMKKKGFCPQMNRNPGNYNVPPEMDLSLTKGQGRKPND